MFYGVQIASFFVTDTVLHRSCKSSMPMLCFSGTCLQTYREA